MRIDYSAIGQRIKARRKGLGKTQDKLAETLGVSIGYISQIERGVTKINLDTLSEIATFLDCDIAELITGTLPSQNNYLSHDLGRLYEKMSHEQKLMLMELARIVLKHK